MIFIFQAYNYGTGGLIKHFPKLDQEITSLTYAPVYKYIICTTWNGNIVILSDKDPSKGIVIRHFSGYYYSESFN